MASNPSVQDEGMLSDERLRLWLVGEINRCINVERRVTRDELAANSRVNVHTIDAIRSSDPGKRRPLRPGVLLSLCEAMGEKAVNGLLAHIAYGGASPLGTGHEMQVHSIVATGLQGLSTIAKAAIDGRIDHIERPECTAAADLIIETILPLSSAGQAE